MTEARIRGLDEQVLGPFIKTFSKRYEQWKRGDLLSVALNTLPKQVKKENVAANLLKLEADFQTRLKDEG
jgi:hypothetical protein